MEETARPSRKWMVLAAAIWIQAFTGTNFDFSSYSSNLKSVLGMSQVQLNYLSVASDMGKALGWCSGVMLMYFPLWAVMFFAAFIGFLGYGLQWLLIQRIISLPYFLVYLLCLLAGCSICWFNTVCYVLCIQNFPTNHRSLALSLIVSFNGLSPALYTIIANAFKPNDDTFYLFLNAVVPLIISALSFIPILLRSPPSSAAATAAIRHDNDTPIFLCLYLSAVFSGLYLLFFSSLPYNTLKAQILFLGVILLVLLSCLKWFISHSQFESVPIDPEFHRELIDVETERNGVEDGNFKFKEIEKDLRMEKGRFLVLEEEHPAELLVGRFEFWLYYIAYFCGGTIGLVYSNNLGQISQSLGYNSSLTNSLVNLYSSCSFFGRLISATPDFLSEKMHFARTGWLALALLPTPIAFSLLAVSGSKEALQVGTGLIGLSSGFIFSASVSITSELFGPNNAGVNHNILITNIPLGSFLYGLLAAVVYDSSAGSSRLQTTVIGNAVVCLGRKCYMQTFVWWTVISMAGLASSFLLFQRTRMAYDRRARRNLSRALGF